jgi:hypothetical protein
VSRRIYILSVTRSGNALGRALSMAMVADRLGECRVLAPADGDMWVGATQFRHQVGQLPPSPLEFVKRIGEINSDGPPVIWASKAFAPLPRYLAEVRRHLGSDVKIVVDCDDDDAGLARDFAARSLRGRLVLNPLRRTSGTRVQRAQESAASVADARTVATWAVAQSGYGRGLRTLRVPHVRERAMTRRTPSPYLRLGFLGTWRSHKGVQSLHSLLDSDSGVRLVSFAQSSALPQSSAWTLLDPRTPLSIAYAQVDVLALPMDRSGPADVQLPAKLVDAFASGTPVIATRTTAITEIAGDAVAYVTDFGDPAETLRAARRSIDSGLGDRGLGTWASLMSPDRVARDLDQFLETV